MKKSHLFLALVLMASVKNALSAESYFSEPAGLIRFEQYLPAGLLMWRMPSPGVSTFPGGTCARLNISGGDVPQNRFFSLYLFLKANGGAYFIRYNPANCEILSFGIDG